MQGSCEVDVIAEHRWRTERPTKIAGIRPAYLVGVATSTAPQLVALGGLRMLLRNPRSSTRKADRALERREIVRGVGPTKARTPAELQLGRGAVHTRGFA
jgi:hypothetical protein